jgi:hypothetical protein
VPRSGRKVRGGEIEAGELSFVAVAPGAMGGEDRGDGIRLAVGREAAGEEEDGEAKKHQVY